MSDATFQQALQRLGALVEEFDHLPYPQIREKVFELLQVIDVVHRTGIDNLVTLIEEQNDIDVLEHAKRDPAAWTLLLLYDLAPEPVANIDVGTRNGGSVTFVSVDQLTRATQQVAAGEPEWVDVARLDSVPDNTLTAFDVGGRHVLVARMGDEVFAAINYCPGSRAPLHLGKFRPPVVICPWHSEAYDIRTGECIDSEDRPRLEVLPVAVEDGVIRVMIAEQPASASSQHVDVGRYRLDHGG